MVDTLDLVSFHLIDTRGELHHDADPAMGAQAGDGTGLYEFSKPPR